MSVCSTTRVCCAAIVLSAFSAQAQSPSDFYKGRSVNVLIGVGVGGFYDLNARVVARHIGRHIPGAPSTNASAEPSRGAIL